MKYFKEIDDTERLRAQRESEFDESLNGLPDNFALALRAHKLKDDKELQRYLKPVVLINENGDRYLLLGNGKSRKLYISIQRLFPNSVQEIPLQLKLEIIKAIYGEMFSPIWLEIDGILVQVTADTFKDF